MRPEKNSRRNVPELADASRDNIVVDSAIHDKIKASGIWNKFFHNKFFLWNKKHPFWFWPGVVGTLITIYQFFFSQPQKKVFNVSNSPGSIATIGQTGGSNTVNNFKISETQEPKIQKRENLNPDNSTSTIEHTFRLLISNPSGDRIDIYYKVPPDATSTYQIIKEGFTQRDGQMLLVYFVSIDTNIAVSPNDISFYVTTTKKM